MTITLGEYIFVKKEKPDTWDWRAVQWQFIAFMEVKGVRPSHSGTVTSGLIVPEVVPESRNADGQPLVNLI